LACTAASNFNANGARAASVLRAGRIEQTYAKQYLPNYEVFDERRYFVPGTDSCVFEVEGLRLGLLICEDAWYPEPARRAREAGAQMLVTINASPYHLGKGGEREQVMRERVRVVMRTAGPRMIWRHPILAIRHVIDGRQKRAGGKLPAK